MTCLGFTPSSVGTPVTQKEQVLQRVIPSAKTATDNLLSTSPRQLLVAQTSSPKPKDTLPTLKKPSPAPKKSKAAKLAQLKWPLFWIGIGTLFVIATGIVLYLLIQYGDKAEAEEKQIPPDQASENTDTKATKKLNSRLGNPKIEPGSNGYSKVISPPPSEKVYAERSTGQAERDSNSHSNIFSSVPEKQYSEDSIQLAGVDALSLRESTSPVPEKQYSEDSIQLAGVETLAIRESSPLAKINIVDQLINELHNPDPVKRRKAIWDLAQRGDTRAMQPLLELMPNVDSQQRSLILEALSQIGSRTLQPMNRALAISLEDNNPEVRKNAIRELMLIYDLMVQVSQMLRHALEDPNKDVQDTARWALGQLNQMKALPGVDDQPILGESTDKPPTEF